MYNISSLKKLKEVSRFFNIFQIEKDKEIYFSPMHILWKNHPEFISTYIGDVEFQHIHVYFYYKNINFKPSHYNIPIFPPGKKMLAKYSEVMTYYGGNLEMVIYNDEHFSHNSGKYYIEGLYFFDEIFHVNQSEFTIKYKLSQIGSNVYLGDTIRETLYHRYFLKYLSTLDSTDYYNKIYDLTVEKIFKFFDNEYGKEFLGTGGNEKKGKVIGVARILDNTKLQVKNSWLNNFDEGDIIIAHSTDVFYMPYIFKCSGIITENNNLLSHASLVSRELDLPLVLGIFNIFTKIFDGDLIEMDSTTGEVKVLKRFWNN